MLETLLRTKLFVPPLRPNLVPRPHLIERLNQGLRLGHKLTLVSAPAGFGKTTLANAWAQQSGRPVAWLSLDEGDSDLTRFLVHLIASLQTLALSEAEGSGERQTMASDLGKGVMGMLQSPQPPPTELILTALLNEINIIPDDFVLVIDDYHVIDAKPVDGALTFLLEHLPPQMHLAIATREDPTLPLARLRARGELIEMRAADLRFTNAEAAAFLNRVMGLNLSAEEIAALENRTEGWIAGLQLAALSMQGRADTTGFIQAFTGSHHFVMDYLVEDVLQHQPEHVRNFLLQTSILDRLSGPLCDAVRFGKTKSLSVQEDGRGLLESLERGNLFVVPLDDERKWYRYHHLFAEVIHAHLMDEQPSQVPALHRRASAWYQHNGSPADAIRHALAAEDFEQAACLVELAWPAMDESFQSATWLGWVKALPDELTRARPVLSVGYAWALVNDGHLEASEARLQDAERWLDLSADSELRLEAQAAGARQAASAEMVVVDQEQFRSLPVSIASARAYLAQALGDAPGSVKYARRALDLLPEGDHFGRGRAAVLLGIAYWTNGELEAAHHSFAGAMASFQKAGNLLYAISFTFILADIRLAQGRLNEAVRTYERSLKLATKQGEPLLQETADLYLGLSELYREQGDLEAARTHLLRSEELGEQSEVYRCRLCRARARMQEEQGDLEGALSQLDEAEQWLFYRTPLPDLRPIAACKARVWISQGREADVWRWVHERGLSVDADVSYMREFEHLTLVRALIVQHKSGRVGDAIRGAMGLLERLLQAAEEGGRAGSVIEILALKAIAHEVQGDIPSALASLEHALLLAEPEGYVRVFVDEGPPMAALLGEAAKHGIAPTYVSQLQAAFGKAESRKPVVQLLIEPLSERELEVLGLLRTELSGPEIAHELMVSLNTVRTHTRNIYNKLGVNNRRAAVRRTEELDLV